MAFGQKTGSLKNLKKTLAKGGGGGAWIKYIPKNGSMNIRFIQEPEEWVNYIEHFDQTARRSFPCSGERDCPGCMTDERKTPRYLTNAVDLDNNERVIPLQLPKDLANRLVVKYEKWGSLTDRDIELSRQGEGLDTTYDLEPDAQMKRNLAKYQSLDLLKVLEDAFKETFGDDGAGDSGDDEDDKPVVKKRKKSASAALAKGGPKTPEPKFTPDEDEDEDVEDDEPEDDEDEAEDEPEVDEDDDDEDEDVYDEESLKAMPLGALRAVAREFGVDPTGKKKASIIKEILETGEEAPF